MKHTKRWVSLLLAVMMTVAAPLSAFAAWEDGFVIPGQNSGSNSYDDLFWDTINKSNSTTISSTTEDKKKEDTTEKEDTGSKKSDEKTADAVLPDTKTFSVESRYSAVPLLADNYTEIYGTDSIPKARSATGSEPYDYLQANGGYVTITADRPLNNILHYDGKIVDNIHIAKWIADDPAALEYPAYCKNPGWKGTAQHADGKYQVDPLESIGATEKKILGIARAGYPYKTPAQLGCNSVDEAYYATHGAIHTAIVGGSLDKWSIQSGDTAKNTRVLNALKKIYNEGIANPYTPPAVTVQLAPVSGSEEATAEGDWVVNTYHFTSSIARDKWKFRILGDDIMAMVENGTIEVYAGSKKIMPQTNVSGAWDTSKAFAFLKRLSENYPVFYASGNHEQRISEHPEIYGEIGKNYEAALKELPLIRLRNQKVQLEKKGIPITVYGLEPEEQFYDKGFRKDGMIKELKKHFGIPDTDRLTILLAHNPRYKKEYLSWGASMTFSGHYHGGVMMLGKKRGAIAPDFRIFPGECGGMHQKNGCAVIVSAGLGEHTIPVRIHNPRELTIVRISALQNEKMPVK